MLPETPPFDEADAARLLTLSYGVAPAGVCRLPGERDQNFRIDTDDGPAFVVKIASPATPIARLEAENQAIDRVGVRLAIAPRIVLATDGRAIVPIDGGLVRLITWMPGRILADVRHRPQILLEEIGRTVATMDLALGDFDQPAIHRELEWDLADAVQTVARRAPAITDADWRLFIERTAARIERTLSSRTLRRSAIHNDVNDHNVLVEDDRDPLARHQRVSGLIDFGDLVYTWTIADLAIAIAYAILDARAPLRTASHVVRGYHAVSPILETELAVLWSLVQLRMCVSAAIAAHQTSERPGDEYLTVSQAPIRRTLPRLAAVPDRFAEAAFREACGLPVCGRSRQVVSWLRAGADGRLRPDVVGSGPTTRVDVGIASPLLSSDPACNDEPALTARVTGVMREAGVAVGVGRYGEARGIYGAAAFAGATAADERRTVHLGIDLFVPAGTDVRAPLDGEVYLVADNAQPFDYGPLVILRHDACPGEPFFTLYGHLTAESIAHVEPGQRVTAGEAFAAVGPADVNGGSTPHLHLQLIVELLDLGAQYPGVCRASEQSIWRELSPDPNLLLRLPEAVVAPEPSSEQTRAARRAHVGPNLSVGYRSPIEMVRGWRQYLYDCHGRRYLDAYNNVPHVGHAHPRVVEAMASQARLVNTNTRYLHQLLGRYAERLIATLPAPLRVCYFVNSGSEANELALRLARAHTGRDDVIVLDAAYHGNTSTLIEISPYKFAGPGGRGRRPWVHVAPLPDTYRGPFKRDDPNAGLHYAAAVGAIVDELRRTGEGGAAFIAETCPSVAGQIICPPGYLAAAYQHVRAGGGVCIADEVQTGYGRTGAGFYAFEQQQVVPDVVVLGKPIGNGYPLGAVVTTDAIAGSFDNGMEFFSTFGGSTVSCAVGLAVLDVVRDERLQEHASAVGTRLLADLQSLGDRHALVGDVRGSGLFAGIELVLDRGSLEPAPRHADYVVNRLRDEGVLIGTDGPLHNVLKIRPPMPFDAADAAVLCERLDSVLGELA